MSHGSAITIRSQGALRMNAPGSHGIGAVGDDGLLCATLVGFHVGHVGHVWI